MLWSVCMYVRTYVRTYVCMYTHQPKGFPTKVSVPAPYAILQQVEIEHPMLFQCGTTQAVPQPGRRPQSQLLLNGVDVGTIAQDDSIPDIIGVDHQKQDQTLKDLLAHLEHRYSRPKAS